MKANGVPEADSTISFHKWAPLKEDNMNKKTSIDLLNKAVADELQAVHQYMYFHFHLDDQGFGPLSLLFKRIAIMEMGHVELLAERILFLKGDVEMALAGPVGLPAVAHCQQALRLKPDSADAHYTFGYALASGGQTDRAIDHYRRATELQPKSAEAHNGLALALADRGRFDEAIVHEEKALEIKPNFTEAHNNIGPMLLQRGRADEAIGHYQKALELQPNFAEAYFNLGVALADRGRIDQAIANYQKALQLKPDFADARRNLEALRAKR